MSDTPQSDSSTDDLTSDVHTRVYSEGDARIETNIFGAWIDEYGDDEPRFETRIFQDGSYLAFAVGYRDDDPDTDARVTCGVRPTPEEAREVGQSLIDAADAAEASAQESRTDGPEALAAGRLRSFLRSVFA